MHRPISAERPSGADAGVRGPGARRCPRGHDAGTPQVRSSSRHPCLGVGGLGRVFFGLAFSLLLIALYPQRKALVPATTGMPAKPAPAQPAAPAPEMKTEPVTPEAKATEEPKPEITEKPKPEIEETEKD